MKDGTNKLLSVMALIKLNSNFLILIESFVPLSIPALTSIRTFLDSDFHSLFKKMKITSTQRNKYSN